MPLRLGAVAATGYDVQLDARDSTPDVLADPLLDGGETSLSRYVLDRLAGDDRLVGLPIFLMRGFRHRCVLVAKHSPLRHLEELAGRRIGLTGWPDSGNTWTRALLRAAGVDLAGIEWTVGTMTGSAVDPRRLGSRGLPDNVRVATGGRALPDALVAGELDAIMTPFMPPGHFAASAPLRHLLIDYPATEREYFAHHGFVPGIHLLAVRRELIEQRPELAGVLVELFERSKQQWWQRRRELADATPWQLAELERTAAVFGADWMPYGVASNRLMLEHFTAELAAQGIAGRIADVVELFAEDPSLDPIPVQEAR